MNTELSIIGITNEEGSLNFDARRLINWYAATGLINARTKTACFPAPGRLLAVDLSGSSVRGLLEKNDALYAVKDDRFYTVTTALVATNRGALLTSTGRVSMASNGLEVMVVDGTYGYIYTIATGAFAQITDGDFPANPLYVTFQDGYFLVAFVDKVYASDLLAGSSWNALSFASPEGDPDNLVAIMSDHRDLVLLGRDTIEFFYNAGTTPFSFSRNTGAFVQKGIDARFSLCQGDNSIFWLGRSPQGKGLPLKLDGYSPQVIGTPAINERIARYAVTSDAIGYIYQEAGHEFWVLTFPTADETLVYDATSSAALGINIWHERAKFGGGRDIANCYAAFNGKHVIGDYASGKLYYQSQDYLDDNGTLIQRTLISEHYHASGLTLFVDELELLMEMGVGLITGNYTEPKVTIEISRDYGHTYESYGTHSIGAIGEYTRRVIIRQLGRARNFTMRLTLCEPVRAYLLAARVKTRIGTS